jgi:hypothetical protein
MPPDDEIARLYFLRAKLGETVSMDDSIRFKCPICGALPNDACVRTDGALTPGPHRGRKSVAPGAKPDPRQDFSQAATRAGVAPAEVQRLSRRDVTQLSSSVASRDR